MSRHWHGQSLNTNRHSGTSREARDPESIPPLECSEKWIPASPSGRPGMTRERGRTTTMSNPLYEFPAACEQTLRALARYPSRTAFSWPDGSLSYQGATDLIGRMQAVFMRLGFKPGTRVALLTANRADSWCAECRRATVAACHHLAASARLARRPAVSTRRLRSADADRRCRRLPRPRRRSRREGEPVSKPSSPWALRITAPIFWSPPNRPAAPPRAASPVPTISRS